LTEVPKPTAKPELIEADSLRGISGMRHGFFSRRGGVSGGLFASLNCGFGSADNADDVAANRARAADALGVEPEALVTAYQVHSPKVAVVTEPWQPGNAPKVDAMVTRTPKLGLGILTADCAPVLFADNEAGVIGAAHAGWRGAVGGVIEATLAAMVGLGADPERIAAAVGPCIAQASYEVGPEFPKPFLDEDAANARFFVPSARAGHFMFDLPGYCVAKLRALDLAMVSWIGRDACAEPDAFFSYRRTCLAGERQYGRNLSAIMIEG
jgi:purine-nucleoside/S-methyl-5'-thioadenosine phosphorylase / adenosine deaminase